MSQTIGPWVLSRFPKFHPLPTFIGPLKIPRQDACIVSFRWGWWTADRITEFVPGKDYPEQKPKSIHWTVPVFFISLFTLLFLAGACVLKAML